MQLKRMENFFAFGLSQNYLLTLSPGRTTEFRFCKKIAWGINDFGQLGFIYDAGWGMAPSDKALVFVDNHDNQRGHGGAGDVLTYKAVRNIIYSSNSSNNKTA